VNRLLNVFLHRKINRRDYLVRHGVVLGYLVLLTALLPRSFRPVQDYTVGKPWTNADLYAPFEFFV